MEEFLHGRELVLFRGLFCFVLFLFLRCFLFWLVAGWSRQPTVPSWDKRLSTSVSKIPWKKICELKRFECSFQNILEWNDSAVKEAAQNAKARFCAKISGLPCDTSLPDLDLYIEDVDWTAYVDPRLLSALNGEPTVSEHSDNDCNHEILDSTVCNQPFIPSGWGGIDDNAVMNANNTMGPGCGNYNRTADSSKGWAHSDEENKNPNVWDCGDRNWRTGANCYQKKERGARYAPGYNNSNTSKFLGDYCQTKCGQRKWQRRRESYFFS